MMSQRIETNWSTVRTEFRALEQWTHLNSATFGLAPRRALEAMTDHMRRRDEFACTDFMDWFDDLDRIRILCARLVHCDAADVAFVPNSSTGMAFLLNGLDWQPGDEILTLAGEFPNQLYSAAALERRGVLLRAVPWPMFYESVSARTRLVALSTVNYATGFRPPIEEISAFLASRGVLLYLDGTQSVGALAFDVATVRPAMLSVNAYKWLMSPNGAGFVYVAPELRRRLAPSVVGWRSDRDWRAVQQLHHAAPRFKDSAERYEGGTQPFPSIYAMGAVIEMLLELGPAQVEARVLDLAERARAMLRGLGAEVNADCSQIVTAIIPGCDAVALAASLKERRIVTAARHGRLRVSPHLYNREEDIAELRSAIAQLTGMEEARFQSVSAYK